MTWQSFHRRGEILRTVIATVDERRDGRLPMDVPGVRETFGDETSLLAALALRWHTRLAGRIEHALMDHPFDLEQGVVAAWHATAREMPGVRAVLDRHREQPHDEQMAAMLATSTAKERVLMASMAGLVSSHDDAAARVGERLEQRARATYRPVRSHRGPAAPSLLGRLKAALAA